MYGINRQSVTHTNARDAEHLTDRTRPSSRVGRRFSAAQIV
jgi:hypothetical protein